MKKKRVFVSLVIVMLICISSLSAASSFYVAVVNPNIGTLSSKEGTSPKGLAIQSTISSRCQPFVIVVNNIDKRVSDYVRGGRIGANSVFIINDGKFESFWHQNDNVQLDESQNIINYADKGLRVSVVGVGEDQNFYTLRIMEKGQSSNISFASSLANSKYPELRGYNGTYCLYIPENYREPIRIYVDGSVISLARN